MPSYLTSTLTYDRTAMMRVAWASARAQANAALSGKRAHGFTHPVLTPPRGFTNALRI